MPQGIQANTQSDYQGLNFDLFPTFLELAGGEPQPDLDAISLVPILEGKTLPASREQYFTRREGVTDMGAKAMKPSSTITGSFCKMIPTVPSNCTTSSKIQAKLAI